MSQASKTYVKCLQQQMSFLESGCEQKDLIYADYTCPVNAVLSAKPLLQSTAALMVENHVASTLLTEGCRA